MELHGYAGAHMSHPTYRPEHGCFWTVVGEPRENLKRCKHENMLSLFALTVVSSVAVLLRAT